MNNKGADQTAQMRRLICAFVVRIWHKTGFLMAQLIWLTGIENCQNRYVWLKILSITKGNNGEATMVLIMTWVLILSSLRHQDIKRKFWIHWEISVVEIIRVFNVCDVQIKNSVTRVYLFGLMRLSKWCWTADAEWCNFSIHTYVSYVGTKSYTLLSWTWIIHEYSRIFME